MKRLCILILLITTVLHGYCPTLSKEMISIREAAFAKTLEFKNHKLNILRTIISIEKPKT